MCLCHAVTLVIPLDGEAAWRSSCLLTPGTCKAVVVPQVPLSFVVADRLLPAIEIDLKTATRTLPNKKP